MSYDLAIWVGSPPSSAANADAEFARRMDAMEAAIESGDVPGPPAPAIIAFVEAALSRFPELDDESEGDCPWASSPLIGGAVGDLIYFPMTFSGADYARDELSSIASSLGLVCYDPQIEAVLPDVTATPATEIHSRADAALHQYALKSHHTTGKQGWFRRLVGRRDR